MSKLRVAVIFGGMSSEHEVSCVSGAAVADNMDTEKFEVIKVGITKSGKWLLYAGNTNAMRNCTWQQSEYCTPAYISPETETHGLVVCDNTQMRTIKLDVIFPVLHGTYGEDGTVQGLFEMAGIPYVGSGVLASATCMNKSATNTIFDAHGFAHTPWLLLHREDIQDMSAVHKTIDEHMSYPVFVKPSSEGSSVGVYKVAVPAKLQEALLLAAELDEKIIVEQAVIGQEVECAVLGSGEDIFATLPGEIESCNEVYDYEAKYQSGDASKLYIPARLSEQKLCEVRDMAKKAYTALGCEGLARVDFFVQEKTQKVLISEINTMPGFTPISMYPKLMANEGISFTELISKLIQLAVKKARSLSD